jgi:hypothetical protein
MPDRHAGMIPGPSPVPLARRLWHEMAAQLAAHVRCCPVHGTTIAVRVPHAGAAFLTMSGRQTIPNPLQEGE